MILDRDFEYAIENKSNQELADTLEFCLTDREHYNLICTLFEKMDSTYQHQFLLEYQ